MCCSLRRPPGRGKVRLSSNFFEPRHPVAGTRFPPQISRGTRFTAFAGFSAVGAGIEAHQFCR